MNSILVGLVLASIAAGVVLGIWAGQRLKRQKDATNKTLTKALLMLLAFGIIVFVVVFSFLSRFYK